MTFRVFFDSGGGNANPYVMLLESALANLGVTVKRMPHLLSSGWLHDNRSPSSYNILHFHWPSYWYTAPESTRSASLLQSFLDMLTVARTLGFYIVWTVHNLYPHDSSDLAFQHKARISFLRHCSGIIAHCQHALNSLQAKFGPYAGHSAIIPHGNYLRVYDPPVEQADARRRLLLPPDGLVFLSFGMLRRYKALIQLIEVFSELPSESGSLVIAGTPFEAALGREILILSKPVNNIHVHPFFIPPKEVATYFAAADVTVVTYSNAIMSGVVMLSHSMGKPILASPVGCIPDYVPQGTGILCQLQSRDALKAAILSFSTFDMRAAATACLRFAEKHTWDECAANTLELYRRIACEG